MNGFAFFIMTDKLQGDRDANRCRCAGIPGDPKRSKNDPTHVEKETPTIVPRAHWDYSKKREKRFTPRRLALLRCDHDSHRKCESPTCAIAARVSSDDPKSSLQNTLKCRWPRRPPSGERLQQILTLRPQNGKDATAPRGQEPRGVLRPAANTIKPQSGSKSKLE